MSGAWRQRERPLFLIRELRIALAFLWSILEPLGYSLILGRLDGTLENRLGHLPLSLILCGLLLVLPLSTLGQIEEALLIVFILWLLVSALGFGCAREPPTLAASFVMRESAVAPDRVRLSFLHLVGS